MFQAKQRNISRRLFERIDIASLVCFRIFFGALIFVELLRFLLNGWVYSLYLQPPFHFSYYGFEWVKPWPGDLMTLHFLILAGLAICITIGFKYRISTALFFLGFTYLYLMDEALYQNHHYLIILTSFLMIFIPAHRAFSLDARRDPSKRSETAPAWSLWILRAQLGIVYFFGGIAKINYDWVFRQEPIRMWMANNTDFPLLGELFTNESAVILFNYSALLLDLLIVPFLLWRRTRWVAFGLIATFHFINSELFDIGIFPWLMIVATLLFFEPHWPRRFLSRILQKSSQRKQFQVHNKDDHSDTFQLSSRQRTFLVIMMIFFVIQIAMPLRQHLYPGDASWTEEGHKFAWEMLVNNKKSTITKFNVTSRASEETVGTQSVIFPQLTENQKDKMHRQPDMILQYSHHIADILRQQGHKDVEIYVDAWVSLNRRQSQQLIDPTVNLAEEERHIFGYSWVLPVDLRLE